MADCRRENDDADLFAEWVREHGRAVRGFLLAMVRRRDAADDLCQEVFCRAWKARSRYRENGQARAYLLKIADRLARDYGRRREVSINLDEVGWTKHAPPDASGDPSEAAASAEQNMKLSAALDRLSPLQRRVLLLRYFGQCSFAEIAEMVECPLNTTLSHCRRGLLRLRELLGEKVL